MILLSLLASLHISIPILLAQSSSNLAQSMISQQMIAAGQTAFLARCSGCHGENADGNGPASIMLNPKPRNLLSGSFKLRSTPMGVLPTIEDLLRTIDQGIPGTSMPNFKEVSSQEKLSIVAYLRSLRPEFKETRFDQQSISLPSPPKEFFTQKSGLIAAAKKGRANYEKSCLPCHGNTGMGDGPSSVEMVDSDERPIKPANLTRPFLKSGPTARDAYKAISTGLEGAPMPSYSDSLSDLQRWELVAYIFYLRGKAAGIYTEKDTLP